MDVYSSLRDAGMEEEQAKVVAAASDLSQVATKADLESVRHDLEQRLESVGREMLALKLEFKHLRWAGIAGFVVLAVLPDNWIAVLLEWILQVF